MLLAVNKMMNQSIKAALLSGLVLPGIGQLSLGYKKRGWMIIFVSFIFIFMLIGKVIQQAESIVEKMQKSGEAINMELISKQTSEFAAFSDNSSLNILLILLILVWAYSILEAYFLGAKTNKKV